MKVVIIGGAGVFGSRLADLLIRDGHDVTLAGRKAPTALARELGAQAIKLDRSGDLAPLWALSPDIVVDAAGPFHAYGDDPYRIPRKTIDRHIHYLDLADDADFCAGLSRLHDSAVVSGSIALSGVSSVPALSSAVVADLVEGADDVDTIRIAILPGNKAPRGRSVIASILHQAGTPIEVTIDGERMRCRSWSDRRTFDLGEGRPRAAYLIRVPDLDLFPQRFGARTVTFHAGLDLDVQGRGLVFWSWLRWQLGLPLPGWLTDLTLWLSGKLANLGRDTGGMVVEVVGRWGKDWQIRRWQLTVRDGKGPCIPGVPIRTVLRNIEAVQRGAGPAIHTLPLASFEDSMADLPVAFERSSQSIAPLFQQVLGPSFAGLPSEVQTTHAVFGPLRLTGRGSVERGKGVWSSLLATVFRFPKATDDIHVEVLKTPRPDGSEIWRRTFGRQIFTSQLRAGPNGMTERFGPLTFDLGLHVANGALHFPVTSGRLGPLPLPRWLLPRSDAREQAEYGTFRFDVALYAPITGRKMVHYRGHLSRRGMEE